MAYADDSLELRIYRIEQDQNSVSLQFFALPRTWHHYTGKGYSLHLVDQVSGASYAGVDVSGRRNHEIPYRVFGKRYNYKQWLKLDIPPAAPRNHALWLILTTWQEHGDAYLRQQIISSDYPLLDDSQVILGELVLRGDGGCLLAVPLRTSRTACRSTSPRCPTAPAPATFYQSILLGVATKLPRMTIRSFSIWA